jgi:hypothetical protein
LGGTAASAAAVGQAAKCARSPADALGHLLIERQYHPNP